LGTSELNPDSCSLEPSDDSSSSEELLDEPELDYSSELSEPELELPEDSLDEEAGAFFTRAFSTTTFALAGATLAGS